MSSTENAEDSEAHAYFRELETIFIDERGAPLLLAPADWQLARRWHEEGIPIELVERVVREVFGKRREKEGEEGKHRILTLRYVRRAVENAWNKQRRMEAPIHAGDAAPEIDVQGRLEALASALPEGLPGQEEAVRAILRLGKSGVEADEVEAGLAALDEEVLERIERGLGAEERAELDRRLEEALAGLAGRLPREELERAREDLRRQLLRADLELPVLSLFAPEAGEVE